jgi:hypothetical protein
MYNTEYNDLNVRTLTNRIFDTKGNVLPKGISFVLSKEIEPIFYKEKETCLIYLDNGEVYLSNFKQHIVNKKTLFENSI